MPKTEANYARAITLSNVKGQILILQYKENTIISHFGGTTILFADPYVQLKSCGDFIQTQIINKSCV